MVSSVSLWHDHICHGISETKQNKTVVQVTVTYPSCLLDIDVDVSSRGGWDSNRQEEPPRRRRMCRHRDPSYMVIVVRFWYAATVTGFLLF